MSRTSAQRAQARGRQHVGVLIVPVAGGEVEAHVREPLDELTTALEDWIKLWNEHAQPFTWTKTADEIIDRICRYCSRISGPGH